MGSTSQEILRSLCSNTDWKYAVFWKLNHRSRMVLTLEDAYYDNHVQNSPSEVKGYNVIPKNMHGGHNAHDPLALAVAKMSYHVYSFGEGIVGKVAVSGEHQWVYPEYYDDCHSAFEFQNIWESQISAGIKTILVVAVGSCGVVQLGSLRKVDENATLVTHIRHLFLAFKDPLADHAANLMQFNMSNPLCMTKVPSECLHVEPFPDCSGEVDKSMDVEESNNLNRFETKRSDSMPYDTSSYLLMEKAAQVIGGHEMVQGSTSGSYNGVTYGFSIDLVDAKHETQVGTDIISDASHVGMSSGCKDPAVADPTLLHYLRSQVLNNSSSSDLAIEADRLMTDQSYACLHSTVHDVPRTDKESSHQNEVFQLSESQGYKYLKGTECMLERKCQSSHFDALISSGSTFAGSELLEALGPAFKKTATGHEELVKSEPGSAVRPTDDMSHSQLTFGTGPENLLDAVVANVSHNDGNIMNDIFSSRSVQSLITSVEMGEPSGQKKHINVNLVGNVLNQLPLAETQQNSSDICAAFSSIGFSSTCPSSSSDQFQTSLEMPKKHKKRAKPGESSRPRPRDRQLIQDRIKELRELVPNGSKCSIDSLLERTIKHMLFLQNVTKHADKLSKSNTKMQHKEFGTQGSSCVVEVGGHLQVCSIVVENLNKQGMVLIEMLCEECRHFLEIANVIKSLDLIILRGITETHGEKTWICFVVESQNNKVMQRMDILWSLMQIFQPKAPGKCIAMAQP